MTTPLRRCHLCHDDLHIQRLRFARDASAADWFVHAGTGTPLCRPETDDRLRAARAASRAPEAPSEAPGVTPDTVTVRVTVPPVAEIPVVEPETDLLGTYFDV